MTGKKQACFECVQWGATGARRADPPAGEKELLSDGKSSKRARRCLLLKQEPKYDVTAAAVHSGVVGMQIQADE